MLDLLLAADQAAYTPERRDLLDGLLENQDRLLTRTMERSEDHGELLGDDFFWCFMGLAMAQGDRAFWRAMQDWGYSLHSEVKHPDAESYERGMELGVWGATFLPPERLDWLIAEGLMRPKDMTYKVTNGKMIINAMEYAMVQGDAEHFDYWLPHYQQHYLEKKKTARGNSFFIPEVINLMLGMQMWQREEAPRVPYPEKGMAPNEAQRRIDALMTFVFEQEYSKAVKGKWLQALAEKPPYAHDGPNFHGVAGWLADHDTARFAHGEELVLLKNKEWQWLEGLVSNGAPLNRTGQQNLARGLAAALLDSPWTRRSHETSTARTFLKQAREHAPDAAEVFFSPPGTGPLILKAIQGQKMPLVRELISMECPLDVQTKNGLGVGALLLGLRRKDVLQGDDWLTTFQHWYNYATPEQRRQAWEQDREHHPKKPFDIFLLEDESDEELAAAIKRGMPLSDHSYGGPSLGYRFLLQLSESRRPESMEKAWKALSERTDHTAQPGNTFMSRTLREIDSQWGSSLAQVVRAALLDKTLPGANLEARPKPRF